MKQGVDLFGQVVVTWPDIFEWCETVAGIPPDSPRLAGYVRAWCVTEKIAAAKLAGTWPINPVQLLQANSPASCGAIQFAPGAPGAAKRNPGPTRARPGQVP